MNTSSYSGQLIKHQVSAASVSGGSNTSGDNNSSSGQDSYSISGGGGLGGSIKSRQKRVVANESERNRMHK